MADTPPTLIIDLPDAEATAALGRALAAQLGPGDTILLEGPIGAGKSHLARALIRERLGRPDEDVPSPTFTLVQTYGADGDEIWHADLYRLTSSDEVYELGLEDAFAKAICLVEWPDRLGADSPLAALTVTLVATPADGRQAILTATDRRWAPVLHALAHVHDAA